MTKRKVEDAELELEVRSMTIKSLKSELESLGVSLLGLAEKEDLRRIAASEECCRRNLFAIFCLTNASFASCVG
jgi:hypothetical protein